MKRLNAGIIIPVLVCAFLSSHLKGDPLLAESFSTWGTYATSPPTNWTINYTGSATANDWHNADWHWSWAGPPETDQGIPTLFWNPAEDGVDEFISPVIDCSSYDEVWVAFNHSYDHYQGTYQARLRGSTNGGGTWTHTVWDYAEISYGGLEGKRDSVNVTTWAAGESEVVFNWIGEGNTGNIEVWNFDNFYVYGFNSLPEEPFDLNVTHAIRPGIKEEGGTVLNPTCRVYNNADSTAQVEILCRIRDIELQETVFEETVEYIVLEPMSNDIDTFSTFTLEPDKKYEVFFLLDHPNDTDEGNNDKTAVCCTKCDQITPTALISPSVNQSGSFNPQATFTEDVGTYRASADAHCRIKSMASQDVVYIQSVPNHVFGPHQTIDITFPQASLTAEGEYEVTFWATDREGGDISAPDLVDTFNYATAVDEDATEKGTILDVRNTEILLTLTEPLFLDLLLYDVCGKKISTLANGSFQPGLYEVNLGLKELPEGIYFIRMISGDLTLSKKVVVLR